MFQNRRPVDINDVHLCYCESIKYSLHARGSLLPVHIQNLMYMYLEVNLQ